MRNPGDEVLGSSPASYEVIDSPGYRDFLNCPWEGEVAILPFSGGRFVGIFSDHETAAGVFPIDGHDNNLASQLAQHFADRSRAGDTATEAFYGLLKQFGVDEVRVIDRLDTLATFSSFLTPPED